jgi:hypothetical protein
MLSGRVLKQMKTSAPRFAQVQTKETVGKIVHNRMLSGEMQ